MAHAVGAERAADADPPPDAAAGPPATRSPPPPTPDPRLRGDDRDGEVLGAPVEGTLGLVPEGEPGADAAATARVAGALAPDLTTESEAAAPGDAAGAPEGQGRCECTNYRLKGDARARRPRSPSPTGARRRGVRPGARRRRASRRGPPRPPPMPLPEHPPWNPTRACDNSPRPGPPPGSRRPRSAGSQPVPVLATFFTVRRGRDPFFKFFMRTIFPRQVREYEEKFGIRFLGWYNVAYGWDFDNVILLELPDYATIDKLEADERTAPSAIAPASGCSNATTRCSCASGWDPTSSIHPWQERLAAADHDRADRNASPPSLERERPPWTDRRPRRARPRRRARARRLPGPAAEQLDRFLARQRRPDRRGRRPDPHRRRPRLPVGRAGPDRSAAAPATRTRRRGEWISETEVIESAAELVELYNPADVYAAFAEAAREAAGLPARADRARRTCWRRPGSRPEETVSPLGEDPYAAAADEWAAAQPRRRADDAESAAARLYDLALTFQERSQLDRGAPARAVRGRGRRPGRPRSAT